MDLHTVYSKTAKASRTALPWVGGLSSQLKRVLSKVDGKLSVEGILLQSEKLSEQELQQILLKLENEGYIQRLLSQETEPVWLNTISTYSMSVGNNYNIEVEEIDTDAFNFAHSRFKPKTAAKLKEAAEQKEYQEAEVRAKADAERKAKEEVAAKAKREAEEQAKRMAERIIANAEAAVKAQQDAERIKRKKAEAVAKAKAEEDAHLKTEAERKAKEEIAAKAKQEAEAQLEAVRIEREKAEAVAKAKTKAEEETRLKTERAAAQAKAVEEARLKAEAALKAKAEAAEKAKLEAEEQAKRISERIAKAEATVKARLEADRIEREKAAAAAKAKAKAQAEEDTRLKAEKERKAKAKAKEQARVEAERKAQAEAAEQARHEAERIARDEEKARLEAERIEREKAAAAAKAKAKAQAEEDTRLKTEKERKAKAKAEEQARVEAERKAQAVAAEQARHGAERIARDEEKAQREAEKTAREEAKRRARQEKEAKAKLKAEEKARPKKIRRPIMLSKWVSKSITALLILTPITAMLIVGLLHAANLSILVKPIEKLASGSIGEPVTVKEVHASLFPQPRLILTDVAVGSGADVRIGTVIMLPDVSTLFEEVKIIKSLEVGTLTLTPADLGRQVQWVNAAAKDDKLKIEQIALKQVSFTVPGLELAPFDGKIARTTSGEFSNVELVSADRHLTLLLTPQNGNCAFTLTASIWQPPLVKQLELDEVTATGVISQSQASFSQIEAKAYGGTIKAQGMVDWSERLSASGNFELTKITLPRALSAFGASSSMDGTLNATATFTSRADQALKLAEAAEVNANFEVLGGKVNGIALIYAVMAGSASSPPPDADSTRFDTLTGKLQFKDGQYKYKKLVLKTDQFYAHGNLDVAPNQIVSGKVNAELTSKSLRRQASFSISGEVADVKLQ
ncbi:MAG: hypothetical protein ACXW11_08175 [Methylotenera sp.]